MTAIKKTYAQIFEFNIAATAYLKKKGLLDEKTAQPTEKEEKDKLDVALLDILMKQIVGKINQKKRDEVERIQVRNAAVHPERKTLLVAEKAVPQFNLPAVYEYTIEGKLKMMDELEKLEETKVDIHCRLVEKKDLPTLTPDEIESFTEYVIAPAKK